jgi:hypothetical protein
MARPMNEDYLRYLTISGITMNYPLWTTIGEPFYNDADLVIPVKRKDISFIKKEIPKFQFPKEPIISWGGLNQSAGSSLGNVSDEDMEYFRGRLLSSLKLPNWFFNSSYGIISDPTPQIFDEFH